MVTDPVRTCVEAGESVRSDEELLALRGVLRACEGGGMGSTDREDWEDSSIDCLMGDSRGASLARSDGGTCNLS